MQAKAAAVPDPIDTLAAKTKAAAQDAKSIANGAGVPDPVRPDLHQAGECVPRAPAPITPVASQT